MIGLSISRGYPLDHDPSRVYYGTDTRAFTMLIGAVLAMVWAPWRLSDKTTRGGRIVLDAIGVIGLVGLTWMFLNVSEFSNDLYRGGFLLCSLLAAMVIAVTVHPAADLSRCFLGLKPMRWIGERSYGIYLWHWPVFMVTRPVLDISLTGTPNLILRPGRHGGARRAVVPVRGAADPPGRARPLVQAAAQLDRLRSASAWPPAPR